MAKSSKSVDYYTVEIPSDCETDSQKRFDLAVMQARENAKFYVMPCAWCKISDDGEIVKLKRIRCKIQTAAGIST